MYNHVNEMNLSTFILPVFTEFKEPITKYAVWQISGILVPGLQIDGSLLLVKKVGQARFAHITMTSSIVKNKAYLFNLPYYSQITTI